MSRILQTKIFVPRTVSEVIERPLLLARLEQGRAPGRRLTIVAAAAGSGKTTLVASWPGSKAWLSLDEDDNDPARFWSYLVAAIRSVVPEVDESILDCFAAQQPPVKDFLVALINELAGSADELALVLDDYHVIRQSAIHRDLQYLLERLPPRVRVVIVARADPPLSLSRLRARGQLTEIREADLRFTQAEARDFLVNAMQLAVSDAHVAQLTARTEGWISGLKLAALSLRGCADASAFVRAFAGSDQYVFDYLVEEVFSLQTAEDQEFLLQTASLERMCGPLCDAVTGRTDGAEVLGRLARANLFVVPLDHERRWFRYHRLFADLLKLRAPSDAALRLRACDWLERHGMLDEALGHARAAGDPARLITLIEQSAWDELSHGRLATVRRWLEDIPRPIVHEHPLLCAAAAWMHVSAGEVGQALPLLETAATSEDPQVRARVELTRSVIALFQGKAGAAVEAAERARDGLGDAPGDRAFTCFVISSASRDHGDFERALQEARDLERLGRETQNIWLQLMGRHNRVVIPRLTGRLREARQLCQEALAFADERSVRGFSITCRIELELASILRDLGEIELALQHAESAIANMHGWEIASDWLLAHLTHARVLFALGRAEEGAAALARADEWHDARDIVPVLRALYRTVRTGVLLKAGRIREAAATIAPATAAPGVLGDMDALSLGRVRLAQNLPQEALDILRPRLDGARDRRFFLVMLRVQSATALDALGRHEEALVELDEALEIGASSGFRQLFLEADPAVAALIEYGLRSRRWSGEPEAFAASLVEVGEQGLVDPLSGRELEVLRLVAEGCTNKEIGQKLFISVGTVKTHVHNVSSKLSVSNRTQAVARARQLGII